MRAPTTDAAPSGAALPDPAPSGAALPDAAPSGAASPDAAPGGAAQATLADRDGTADGAAFLRLRDLVKTFDGVAAVDRVSLDIARGEIFALLGSSGCGKSTLLRLLAGFETPTAGSIVLDGRDLAALPPHRRPLNMMFQSYALFPHLTVHDNVAFGLRRQGLPRAQVAERVEAMLALVQLQAFGARKPHQLSGGQQQRVALARSLARQPQLLLLDEPLGALDRKLREQTQIELVGILRQVGVTCVMVTHDQEEAMTMAGRIAVMSEGRLVQVGAPAQVYENPATRFVAGFIGNVNLLDGTVGADAQGRCVVGCVDAVVLVAGAAPAPAGSAVTVALRPEKIALARVHPGGDTNVVAGTVQAQSYFGNVTVHHLRLASGAVLKVAEANTERERAGSLAHGQTAWAHWSASAAVVLTR